MCKILMPINPKYVNEILLGNKKYEYRKTKAKKDKVDKMIIYSTSPVMKVVAEVDVVDVLEESPEKLWEITNKESGVTKDFYDKYYKDKNIAIAYKLGNVKVYTNPKSLKELGITYIPQSFIYLS